MKKNLIGYSLLAAGGAAALLAAAVPGAALPTSAADTVPGIVHEAEAFGTADDGAEAGLREAVRRCMAGQGFDYTPPDSQVVLDLQERMSVARLTVDQAKARGYSPESPGPAEPEPDSPEGKLLADPAFAAALNGPRDGATAEAGGLGLSLGGCRAGAVETVYGSGENYLLATGWANNAFAEASGAAMYDAGFTAAITDWRACMAATPFSYDSPFQSVEAGKQLGGHEELQLAVTDAGCRGDTGFHERIDEVLDKYLTARMQELAPRIEQVRGIREAAAASAARL